MAWSNFLEQERVIAILKSYLSSDRIPHALIFSGIEGIGKFSLAKEFAKACNCLKYEGDACDRCVSCLQIERQIHPDFFIIRPSGKSDEIIIDMIRELQRFLYLSPQTAQKKFFLIDEAERMNLEASNAFLKSLEEPPLDSVIILITTRVENLLLTIRSRCQEIKFHPLKKIVIQKILQEKYGIENSIAEYLASIAQGSVSRALEFKDKDIYNEINNFFSPQILIKVKDLELSEQRRILKEKMEALLFLLRDSLMVNLGVPELTFINNYFKRYNTTKCRGKDIKDLIEKIEKLEYLYNALEANVTPQLIYNVGKQIWEDEFLK